MLARLSTFVCLCVCLVWYFGVMFPNGRVLLLNWRAAIKNMQAVTLSSAYIFLMTDFYTRNSWVVRDSAGIPYYSIVSLSFGVLRKKKKGKFKRTWYRITGGVLPVRFYVCLCRTVKRFRFSESPVVGVKRGEGDSGVRCRLARIIWKPFPQ